MGRKPGQQNPENTLLWAAFSSLSRPELREFERFVQSPFVHRKPHLPGLFVYLRDCLQEGRLPAPEAAFRAAYGKKEYRDTQMRLANSHLLEVLEQFWMYREKMADPVRNKLDLAAIYRRRNLPKHARITLREAGQTHDRQPLQNAARLSARHDVELERFQIESAAKRYESFNLQEISDLLDQGFIARKLRHSCLVLSHQAVFKADYDLGMQEAVLQYVETRQLFTLPAIGLYYHACRFLSDPMAEAHFFQFRDLLSAHPTAFPAEELRTLYLLAINFGLKKTNAAPGPVWDRANFELYREALSRNLLLDNGLLSHFAYNNVVVAAIRLGETDWAENFIQQYKPLLERRYRESIFSLNMARMCYVKKDHSTALQYLQRADYRDFIHSMNAKTLQMKIYFESGATDLLESHLDSMQHYIRRQRAVGYHRANCLNIVRYTRALLRCNRHDSDEIRILQAQINQETVLTEKDWLLEQLTKV